MKKIIRRILIVLMPVLIALTPNIALADTGVDVSNWQGCIDAQTAHANGANFAIVKTTEGTNFVDPYADCSVQRSLQSGMRVGVYHFARPEHNSASSEANAFINATRGYVGKGIIPVLDWEAGQRWNSAWAKIWLDTVASAWGTKPMIYMSAATLREANWNAVAGADYGLWLAGYPSSGPDGLRDPGKPPYDISPWKVVALWQYTSTASVPGVGARVDADFFYGDSTTWAAYASSPVSSTPAPAPRPEPARPTGMCVVVRSGDSLSVIAMRTGLQPWSAWSGYRSGDPAVIYPGETVCYGGGSAGRTVVVRSGDTLSGIAARLGVPMGSIHGYRSGNPNVIYPGEVLSY